jgi:hypothetical protein
MQNSQAPTKVVEAFGVSAGAGYINAIPAASQIGIAPGRASLHDGFVPLNATPVPSGGIPPFMGDMNGILNLTSGIDWWKSAGASFAYDSVFSAAIGGYPKGARLLNAAFTGFWISAVENNTTDPDTGGAGWIPDRANATVYASAQQTLAASAATKVLWDTVESDPFGLWNSGSKVFQAIWAGKYRLSGAVYLPAPDGQNLGVMVYKNGSLVRLCSQFPQVSSVALSYPYDAIATCSAGDTLEVMMNVSQTAVLAGQSGSNEAYVFGQIEFLGA